MGRSNEFLFRPMKIDIMFLVSHFQKIGEGIFSFFIIHYFSLLNKYGRFEGIKLLL